MLLNWQPLQKVWPFKKLKYSQFNSALLVCTEKCFHYLSV